VARKHTVRGALWQENATFECCDAVVVGDIDSNTDWGTALDGIDVVIHLAARVRVMRDETLSEYRIVNVDGTGKLEVVPRIRTMC
jgi:nucleoside-diphosphate-sugar epimerase